jgi:uncharacterized membrane protein
MKVLANLDRLFPYAFLAYGLALTLLVAVKLPPFMGPDELNHIKRASQLSRGVLLGDRILDGGHLVAGGRCEVNLDLANSYYQPIEFHPEIKVDPASAEAASRIEWGDRVVEQPFNNTAINAPTLYLPQALAIGIGKVIGLPIVSTIHLARIANAIFCLAVGFFALRLAGRAAPLLFTILLLPMAAALDASVTQDGPLIATAALASAILVRHLLDGRNISKRELVAASICLVVVAMAKAPYAVLLLLIPLMRTARPRWLWAAAATCLAVVAGWHLFIAVSVYTPMARAGVPLDPAGQVAHVMHNPGSIFPVAFNTLRHGGAEYAAQMIGVLGWLDTPLPKVYYGLAFVAFAAAVAAVWGPRPDRKRTALALLILLATALALFAGFYVTYTPVGFGRIEGVQGRYILPIAAMLPLVVCGIEAKLTPRLQRALALTILAFPIVGIVIVEHALAARYY